MSPRTLSRPRAFLLPGILLAVCIAILSLPDQRLSAATCGGEGDLLCSETTTCSRFWIFRYKCSSSFEYLGEWEEPEGPPVE